MYYVATAELLGGYLMSWPTENERSVEAAWGQGTKWDLRDARGPQRVAVDVLSMENDLIT